jgi:hypothetical protein
LKVSTNSAVAPQDVSSVTFGDVITASVGTENAVAAAAIEPASTSRKWAGRRRPNLASRQNPAAARSEASQKISDMAETKRRYYTEKLEMLHVEHEQRMKVMRLEEQRLEQQIAHDRQLYEE